MKRTAARGRGQSQSQALSEAVRERLSSISRHAGIEPTWARLSLAARILLFFPHRSSQVLERKKTRKKTGGREGRSRSLKRKLSASAERQD